MRLIPPIPTIDTLGGFTAEADLFGHAIFGTSLVKLFQQLEHPLVLALDGPWGTGKSTFVKMWAGLLRQNGFPVVYFDAFANDYLMDAFGALAGEIALLGSEAIGKQSRGYKKFLKTAGTVGRVLAQAGGKIAVKAATAGALDMADIQALVPVKADIASDASKLVEEAIKSRLEARRGERQAFEAFSDALQVLVGSVAGDKETSEPSQRPLIFLVDELDRCRPDFAIELLGTVYKVAVRKHLRMAARCRVSRNDLASLS